MKEEGKFWRGQEGLSIFKWGTLTGEKGKKRAMPEKRRRGAKSHHGKGERKTPLLGKKTMNRVVRNYFAKRKKEECGVSVRRWVLQKRKEFA